MMMITNKVAEMYTPPPSSFNSFLIPVTSFFNCDLSSLFNSFLFKEAISWILLISASA